MWQQGKDSLEVLSRCAWRKPNFWDCALQPTSPSIANAIPFSKLIFNSLANDIQNHRECNISILKLTFVLFFWVRMNLNLENPTASKTSSGDPLKTVWVLCYLFTSKWKHYSRSCSLSFIQTQQLWRLHLAEGGFCESLSVSICWFGHTFFCQNGRRCQAHRLI